jgi:hypothetical protein
MYSDYVAEQMSMSDEQKQIVYQVLLDRMYNSNTEIKSKNLTMQKDKQVVYAAQTKIAQQKLKSEFGKDSWKILKLTNEARKNASFVSFKIFQESLPNSDLSFCWALFMTSCARAERPLLKG